MTYEITIATADGHYLAVIDEAQDGRYAVTYPAIDGLHTEGETVGDAFVRAHACLAEHLTTTRKAGRELPVIRFH